MKDLQKIKEFFSKSLEEVKTDKYGNHIEPQFKKGDKVTYLGHPAEITAINKEMDGTYSYSVSYNKGQGKTKASNLKNKGGEIKLTEASNVFNLETAVAELMKAYHLNKEKALKIINTTPQIEKIINLGYATSAPEALGKVHGGAARTFNYLGSLDKINEEYTVAGHSVTLNKGTKSDGTDWTVTFKNGKSKPLSDVLALIKPMPKGITMNEVKEETGVDMAKKRLDALGVKYEMSKTDKVRPFKVIYKPVNKSDKFYDEFEDIVDLFNLKGFVKQSMEEAKFMSGLLSGKDFINAKLKNYPKAIAKVNQLIDMIGESRFTIEMAEWIWDFFNNASFEQPVNETKSISDYKIGDIISFKDGEDWKVIKVKDNIGKLVIKPHNEKAKKGNVSLEIDIDADYLKKNLLEAKSEDKVDTITMDIPLFLRMLEYSREDASQDMDLHDVTEKANKLGKERGILSMEDYEEIVGAAEEIKELKGKYMPQDKLEALDLWISDMLKYKKPEEVKQIILSKLKANLENNTEELTEANVPSNIRDFAKRKGISSLVNKVAGWAEKVGARIAGGTAIGKNYSTLVLDLDYKQQGEIRIDTDEETIELYDEPVYDFKSFQRVYLEGQDGNLEENSEVDEVRATIKFIKENTPEATTEEVIAELKEIKKLGEQLNEELCPAGKAYIKRRQAAGEKSSAYLSGRGVKVCKGQMSGRKKKK